MASLLISSHLQYLLILTFTFFIFPLSLCQDNVQFSNCTQRFICGDVAGVGYPFWGNGRANYCGWPGLELQCRNNIATVININSKEYSVTGIYVLKNSIQAPDRIFLEIARMDFLSDGICLQQIDNTALDFTLFNYTANDINLTLFYGCSSKIGLPSQATCHVKDGDEPRQVYFNVGSEKVSGNEVAAAGCERGIVVPVNQTVAPSLKNNESSLGKVINQGFEVQLLVDLGPSIECSVSGGVAGYSWSSNQPICFCSDKSYERRCPTTPTAPAANTLRVASKSGIPRKIAIAALIPGAFILVAAIAVFYCMRRKFSIYNLVFFWNKAKNAKNVEELLQSYGSLGPTRYKYSDVKKMTNSFKDKLGQGGYGSVFKGKLFDGRLVAVKVLSESKGNGEEFINEVASISRTSHINIVSLLGFCLEGPKRALIYEFMSNGSLEKFIYDGKPVRTHPQLGLERLFQIAIGIARGLEYLHRGCKTRILHLDIKPHNILLDQDFCPRISDFGLSKLCPPKESIISMVGMRGTAGYIAPEVFFRNFGGVSHKSDVYSYGMMVLEMVGGRRNNDVGLDHTNELYCAHWIYEQLKIDVDQGLHEILTKEEEEIVRKMILVGLWCIQTDPAHRPSMNKVVEMLDGSLASLQTPPKPYLYSSLRSPPSSSNT